jgi:hypothetical protein
MTVPPWSRLAIFGGRSQEEEEANDQALCWCSRSLLLAPDGGGWRWDPATYMPEARGFAAVGQLPATGHVVVAGGLRWGGGPRVPSALRSALAWDPAADKWVWLPPMHHARAHPVGCVLPSGRFAVLGGHVDQHQQPAPAPSSTSSGSGFDTESDSESGSESGSRSESESDSESDELVTAAATYESVAAYTGAATSAAERALAAAFASFAAEAPAVAAMARQHGLLTTPPVMAVSELWRDAGLRRC